MTKTKAHIFSEIRRREFTFGSNAANEFVILNELQLDLVAAGYTCSFLSLRDQFKDPAKTHYKSTGCDSYDPDVVTWWIAER